MNDTVTIRVWAGALFTASLFAFLMPVRSLFVICAAAVHECGHILCLYATGRSIFGVDAGAGGFAISCDDAPVSLLSGAASLAAGPAANLAAAGAFLYLGRAAPGFAHLALGLFNLLPLREADGGRLLELAAYRLLRADRAKKVCAAGDVLSLLLCAAEGMSLLLRGGRLSTLPAVCLWLLLRRLAKRRR